MGTSRPVPTRAEQAGLRLEDVPRPSLGQLLRRDRLDTKIRRALGRVVAAAAEELEARVGRPCWGKRASRMDDLSPTGARRARQYPLSFPPSRSPHR